MTEFRVGVTHVWTVQRAYKPINPPALRLVSFTPLGHSKEDA